MGLSSRQIPQRDNKQKAPMMERMMVTATRRILFDERG